MRKIVLMSILLVLTPCGMVVVYGDFNALRHGFFSLFLFHFDQLPWVRMSILLTAFTCTTAHLVNKDNDLMECGMLHAFLTTPFVFLLTHPGLKSLGWDSDPSGYSAVFIVGILHGIGFVSIGSLRQEQDEIRCENIKQETLSEFLCEIDNQERF